MPRLGLWEIIIIAIVLLVFFGANRIPEMMRGLAKGMKGFKEEMKSDDDTPAASTSSNDTTSSAK